MELHNLFKIKIPIKVYFPEQNLHEVQKMSLPKRLENRKMLTWKQNIFFSITLECF